MYKSSFRHLLHSAAAVLLLGALSPAVQAQCSASLKAIKPAAWSPLASSARIVEAGLQLGAPADSPASIVGMWHVVFTAKTMNGGLIPDLVVDNAILIWHEDKTEIMNSGRPPQDGNFCLGVWENAGPRTFYLNHFAWSGNAAAQGAPDGTVGSPIGPVHYRELATVGPEGKHYSGTFSLEQYDTTGKVAVSFTGTMKATRITVDTTVKDLLQ